MNIVDRVLLPFFPGLVASRLRSRRLVQAYYEGAEPSRLRKKRGTKASADRINERSAEALRDAARWLERNFDVAHGALTTLTSNIVGSGIMPEPQARLRDGSPAIEVNEELADLFKDWARRPEVTGDLDYYQAQTMACRSVFRDGEIFGQHLRGQVPSLRHNTRVPYSIEILESDFVPYLDGQDMRQGVRKNAWGRPLAYTVYLRHPGEGFGTETKVVPAEDFFHVKLATRFRQTRGVTVFASVFARFDDLREIDESERVAARVAAAMTAYIKKGIPEQYQASDYNAEGEREIEFSPGMVWDDLQPGEDVGTINSNRPNNALIPFRDSQLRSAAAGLGVSFSSLARSYDGSYSSQRQELVEAYQTYSAPWQMFVARFCQPIWEQFVGQAINRMRMSPDVDLDTIYDCNHSRPAIPWIDPKKEIEADIASIRWMIQARSDVQRRRGINPQETRDRIVRERKMDEEQQLWTPDDMEFDDEGAFNEE